MRFARGDMRDHIVSHKNDHGASYRRYGVLPWRSWLKINFCEIFGVVRFSTFATPSPSCGVSRAGAANTRAPRLGRACPGPAEALGWAPCGGACLALAAAPKLMHGPPVAAPPAVTYFNAWAARR